MCFEQTLKQVLQKTHWMFYFITSILYLVAELAFLSMNARHALAANVPTYLMDAATKFELTFL